MDRMNDPADAAETGNGDGERHASWPELFFDLVAVAGIATVAHQLDESHGWRALAILAVAFTAFWVLWASVTTYGNLLADRASTLVLFASMAVLGVMVAAVPGVFDEHARVFAIAYVIGRVLMARPWNRGSVVVDMPIVQASVGVLPWIASIWVDGTARYVLWAVGVALDLFTLLTYSGERAVETAQRRLDLLLTRRGASRAHSDERQPDVAAGSSPRVPRDARRQGGRDRELPTTITALSGDASHLSERMGLFVLIILGEAIIQLTVAAQESEHWDRQLLWAALGAFVFVSTLFLLGVVRGTAGLALLASPALLPSRVLWVGHLLVAMSLVTVGAALGRLLAEPHEPPSAHTVGMLAIGTAVFALVSGVAHLLAGTPRALRMALAVTLPLVAAAIVLQLARASVTSGWAAWILAAGALATGVFGLRASGLRRPAAPSP